MEPVSEVDLAKLEAEFALSRKEKMLAHNMLEKVAKPSRRRRQHLQTLH